jgi:hypothetical protein
MAKKWDFKNSPAADKLRKAGKATVEYLGLTDPEPEKTEPEKTRNDHFDHGATEHHDVITGRDAAQAEGMEKHWNDKGYDLISGSEGNVSSIVNGFLTPKRQAKSKGFK